MLEPPVTPIRKANDGLELPATGFGTYKVNGLAGVDAIKSAIHQGYRLIDSAFNYENEAWWAALSANPVCRAKHIIVTSQADPAATTPMTRRCSPLRRRVCRMGLDYIDLYLIHWPNRAKASSLRHGRRWSKPVNVGWSSISASATSCPAILICSFAIRGVTPAVNQVELHPYFQQREQLAYDNAHGIITEAWSPLGRANQMLRDPDLKRIAAKHGISVVQAILRWHLQYGDVAIPKSLNPERQRQNLDLTAFELDDQDMADIAAMDNPEGHTFGQNPHWHEEA